LVLQERFAMVPYLPDTTVLSDPAAPETCPPLANQACAVLPEPTEDSFVPPEPTTLEEAGLPANELEALILKLLLTSGPTIGRRIAEQLRLPFGLITEQLRSLRAQLLVTLTNEAKMGDFEYELTEEGRVRAHWHAEHCTYCGAAPVPLDDYIKSVEQQSLRKVKIRLPDLRRALSDLTLPPATLSQLGQAIHAGRGLLLYGQPGNGKTSIAEQLVRAVSDCIWVPRTITVTGEIIRLFDPANHEEAPLVTANGQYLALLRYDRRWVRIRRPLIVVGGELRLEQLEIAHNQLTGILESTVQLKSNGGALVVDDFGRQRCSPADLLNRWIVPLEKGHDFLTLPSGRQIQVPFDQLLVFSTNLPPHKLVDEAFLRRIPYKIEVVDPTPHEFRDLVQQWCTRLEVGFDSEAVEYLLARHYGEGGRPLRYCQARDLVKQVRSYCEFQELPPVLSVQGFDVAVKNYFAGL
jgi:predicted ATPase with chaperone activity